MCVCELRYFANTFGGSISASAIPTGPIISKALAMATNDLLIEAYAMVVELKAEVAVLHTHCEKLERVMGKLQEAHGIKVPKRECPASDPQEEQEHKRLKACFQRQKRGDTKTASLGDWGKTLLSDDDVVKSELPTVPMWSASVAPTNQQHGGQSSLALAPVVDPPQDSLVPASQSMQIEPTLKTA